MHSGNKHDIKVLEIRRQVKLFYSLKRKLKIYHGSTNSTRKQIFKKDQIIDISALNEIISIDVKKREIIIEPNVGMEQLLDATLEHGLMPPVVPEFPSITVGGAIQGGAGESSSFKYGGFHDACIEYEVILGNGELKVISNKENPDLFRELPGTYGTLGIITKVAMKLIPAKSYVELIYNPVTSFKGAVDLIEKSVSESIDFMDGIMFRSDLGTVITGKFTDLYTLPKSTFHKLNDEWFYIHAETITGTGHIYKEYIPIKDYIFRYDRGAFWMAKYGMGFLKIPFNRFTRIATSPFSTAKFLYRQLHAANYSQRYFVQDLCFPVSRCIKFLEYLNNAMPTYPLWLLPIDGSVSTRSNFSPVSHTKELTINIGVWSEIPDYERFIKINREIEKKVTALGGYKTLYAHLYYSENEFWRLYDKDHYDKIRQKYKATVTLPNITSKILVTEKYHPSVSRAVRKFFKFKLSLT